MPEPTRLPIHRECRHGHHATAAELVDQLAAQRDQARAALDRAGCHNPLADAVERIDRARARYATRPGSTPGGAQGAVSPAESHAQPRVGPERDYDTTCPPIGMQAFLDYSTAEFTAASTADQRVEAVRDLLEGWYDRWDAHYPGAVVDEHDGIARHLVTLITAAEAAP